MSNLASHKLSVGVTRKALADWGIVEARINLNEGGDDTLTIVESAAGFNGSAFSPFSRVEFWDPSGIRRFSGDLVRPQEQWQRGELRTTWQAQGPGFRLTKLPFKQPRSFMADPTLSTSDLVDSDTADVVLNRVPPPPALRATIRDELSKVFTQAALGGAYVTTTASEIPNQDIAAQEMRSARLWDVLLTLKRSMPHVAMRWDYDSKVLNSTVRAVWLTYEPREPGSLTGAMKQGDAVAPGGSIAPSQISGDDGIRVEGQYELMVPKLKVQFIWRNVVTVSGRQEVFIGLVEQVSEIANGAFGEMWITVELTGAAIDDGEVTQDPEPVPSGNYAAFLHIAFGRLWHKCEWTIQGAQCDFSIKVGQMWQVTGLGRLVEGVVLQVTHEIVSGRTTVTIGPPTRLTVFSLPLIQKLQAPVNQYGGKGKDEDESAPVADDQDKLVFHGTQDGEEAAWEQPATSVDVDAEDPDGGGD